MRHIYNRRAILGQFKREKEQKKNMNKNDVDTYFMGRHRYSVSIFRRKIFLINLEIFDQFATI